MPSAFPVKMFQQTELDNYKLQVELLQEKLQRSEEQRQQLEQKFEKIQWKRNENEKSIKTKSRRRFEQFLDEQQKRNERNRNIVKMLEQIDEQAAALASKSERLKIMKLQYELYFAKLLQSQAMRKLQSSPRYSIIPINQMMTSQPTVVMPPILQQSIPIATTATTINPNVYQNPQNLEQQRITTMNSGGIPISGGNWNGMMLGHSNFINNANQTIPTTFDQNYIQHGGNELTYHFPNQMEIDYLNRQTIFNQNSVGQNIPISIPGSLTTPMGLPIRVGGSIPIMTSTTMPSSKQKIYNSDLNESQQNYRRTSKTNQNYQNQINRSDPNEFDENASLKSKKYYGKQDNHIDYNENDADDDDGDGDGDGDGDDDVKKLQEIQNCKFYENNSEMEDTRDQLQLNKLRLIHEDSKPKENINNKFDFGKSHYNVINSNNIPNTNEPVTHKSNREFYKNHPISLQFNDKLSSVTKQDSIVDGGSRNRSRNSSLSNDKDSLLLTNVNDDNDSKTDIVLKSIGKSQPMNVPLNLPEDNFNNAFLSSSPQQQLQQQQQQQHQQQQQQHQQQQQFQRLKPKPSDKSANVGDYDENGIIENVNTQAGNYINRENQNRNPVMWNFNGRIDPDSEKLLSSTGNSPSKIQKQFIAKEKLSIENFENVVYGELINPTEGKLSKEYNGNIMSEPIKNQIRPEMFKTNVTDFKEIINTNQNSNNNNDNNEKLDDSNEKNSSDICKFEPKAKISFNDNKIIDENSESVFNEQIISQTNQDEFSTNYSKDFIEQKQQQHQQQQQQQPQYYNEFATNPTEYPMANQNETVFDNYQNNDESVLPSEIQQIENYHENVSKLQSAEQNNSENFDNSINLQNNEPYIDQQYDNQNYQYQPEQTNNNYPIQNQEYQDNNTEYQNYQTQDVYDPNSYGYNYEQQDVTYQNPNQQYSNEIYDQQNVQYPTAENYHPVENLADQYQNFDQQLTANEIIEEPIEQTTEERTEQIVETKSNIEPLLESKPIKSNVVKPILSKDKSIDVDSKKKKKVNFVDSSETDESSSIQKQEIQSSINNDESDFDFSSTA